MSKRRTIVLVLLAAALLLAGALTARDGAAWAVAWLFAFVLATMVPVGSLAMLLAFGITGGRWGKDLAPVLVPAARAVPLLLLALIPVLVTRGHVSPLTGAAADAGPIYLNPIFFDARSIIAILIWTYLAWSEAWRKPLTAGLGLTAHLILMSLLPGDWILTLPPGSTSAGFGLGFGIEQMFAALAFAALLARQGGAPRASRDLAGLMVTTLLGAMYFIYMQFLIIWYGNIPEKVEWYVARAGWWPLGLAAFVLGAALPFLAILHPAVRRDPALLRWVGGCALVGVVLHVAWLTMPAAGAAALVCAVFSALALGLLLIAAERAVPRLSWSAP